MASVLDLKFDVVYGRSLTFVEALVELREVLHEERFYVIRFRLANSLRG